MSEEDVVKVLRKVGTKGPSALLDYFEKEKVIDQEVIDKVRGSDMKRIISDHYPYRDKLQRPFYEEEKERLQIELVKLQNWVKRRGEKIVIVFEGRDAAGKGGTIKRFTEHLNPRGARVVALSKPTDTELGQWYFQRYVQHMPTNGEIIFFDRSWYNRAGVEKVMGFCSEKEYLDFAVQVSQFETMLMKSGIHLVKFWFSVSREEQFRRFISRMISPLKQWKLSPMDIASLSKWKEYTEAKESMFFISDTPDCPWRVVRSDCKKRARLASIRYILSLFDYDEKDKNAIGELDHKIIGSAAQIYEPDELLHREIFSRTDDDSL